MEGIYIERNSYKIAELTAEDLMALDRLGIKFKIDTDEKIVKILKDTSKQDHCLCDDEDAIAFVKASRMRNEALL